MRGMRDPLSGVCGISNSASSGLPILTAVLVADVTLLGLILLGLVLRHGHITFGIGKMLWHQGVIWIVVATVAEVPTVVRIARFS